MDEPWLERSSDALSKVLHETYFSKKLLHKPPFTFLHKAMIELLAPIRLFSSEQLQLKHLKDKDDKARFLTRALAWVRYMQMGQGNVDVLLLVSPIKILAGLEAENTNEFLFQLAISCASSDDAAKTNAVDRVKSVGDAELYTIAVKFRAGLIKGQAVIRGHLCRKEFVKTFEGHGVFRGIVKARSNNGMFTVYYPEDGDEEELERSEIEQLIAATKPETPLDSPSPPKSPEMSWQAKFRMILEKGRQDDDSESRRLKEIAIQETDIIKQYKSPKPVLPNVHVPGGIKSWKRRNISNTKASPVKKYKPPTVRAAPVAKKEAAKQTRKKASTVSFLPGIESTTTSVDKKAQQLIQDVVERLEAHLKARQMRVVDIFRRSDADGNGYITRDEMIEALKLLDIRLSKKNADIFIDFIDEDGNGMIDVEEFERFVRTSRRIAARKERLEKELQDQTSIKTPKTPDNAKYTYLARYHKRLIDLFRVLDSYDEGAVSAQQFRTALDRIELKNTTARAKNDLVQHLSNHNQQIQFTKLCGIFGSTKDGSSNSFLDSNWVSRFDIELAKIKKENEI